MAVKDKKKMSEQKKCGQVNVQLFGHLVICSNFCSIWSWMIDGLYI